MCVFARLIMSSAAQEEWKNLEKRKKKISLFFRSNKEKTWRRAKKLERQLVEFAKERRAKNADEEMSKEIQKPFCKLIEFVCAKEERAFPWD